MNFTNFEFYTAQYKYDGSDRLDITVKGQDPFGKIFAPTWNMVTNLKDGYIRKEEYAVDYISLLDIIVTPVWKKLLSLRSVTFVCFCNPDDFCHRFLLAYYLKNKGATYLGERSIEGNSKHST